MIKRFVILLVILFLLMPPLDVLADVVFGNEFFYQHQYETKSLERRRFAANGPHGTVSAKEEPGAKKEIVVYQNGAEVLIASTYVHNGKYWGITPISHGMMPSGWIPMDQLLVMYIRDDFYDEHMNEFYSYTGSYDEALSAGRLVAWEWPGSDRAKRILEYDSFVGETATIYSNPSSDSGFIIKDISADFAYMDNEGREWGYVNITYSYKSWENDPIRSGNRYLKEWICLSEPENSNIPAFNPAPEPTKWVPGGKTDFSSAPESTINAQLWIVLIIAILLIATAVLIMVFWKPRTRRG